MKKANLPADDFSELRSRAEEFHQNSYINTTDFSSSPGIMLQMIHELSVHQIELKMQQEQLIQSRTELEESLQRYTELYEFAPCGYLTLTHDSTILQVNLTTAKMFGIQRSLLQGNRLKNFITPEDCQKINAMLLDVFSRKEPGYCEVRLLTNAGKHAPNQHAISGLTMRIDAVISNDSKECRAVVVDITKQVLADNQLKTLSAAVHQSPSVVVITDSSGDIQYVNPVFTKLTGYSINEVRGQNPRILQSGLMQRSFYENLWQTILSGNIWRGEIQNRKKNGDLYWERIAISGIVKGAVITNFVALKEDITEQKNNLLALTEAKVRAEESDRLKSAFLANISHEIRTPMNGILGLSELLNDSKLSEEEQSEYIGLIKQSGERMLNIINELIDISRIEAGEILMQKIETPVNQLLHDLLAFFKPEAEKKGLRLSCTTGLSDNEIIIETDSSKFIQILTNLIKNALKFTISGSIDFGYTNKDRSLEFYVIDSGIGIPTHMKERIFERFHQVDNSLTRHLEGAGLGLSISRAYVTLLGGTLNVETVEGRGSKFFFTLPYNHPAYLQSEPLSPIIH